MATLADLHRTVQAALASKRLGQGVFVRYHIQSPAKPGSITHRLASILSVVSGWLDQSPERIYAQGPRKTGPLNLTVEYRNGTCAEISWAEKNGAGASVDLMVVGNRGVLYHDFGLANSWDSLNSSSEEKLDPIALDGVERALKSDQPVIVQRGK